MRRFTLLAAIAALTPLGAQTFDPDPSEPNAQATAESRASSAFVGLAPPPIGWNCSMRIVWFERVPIADFVCEPDALLIEQQERERLEWQDRLIENSRRFRGRGR